MGKKPVLFLCCVVCVIFSACNKHENNTSDKSGDIPGDTRKMSAYKQIQFNVDQIITDDSVLYRSEKEYFIRDTLRTPLYFDFYRPKPGDSEMLRPLIILIHGGGFADVTNSRATMTHEAIRFARYGFCVAAIDYRITPRLLDTVGFNTVESNATYIAVLRAVQDARFAIRRAKALASEARIDTNYIFLGGVSSGAITALQSVFLDDSEIPANINIAGIGALDFTAVSGYSAHVSGAFAYAGGLINLDLIQSPGVPVFNLMSKKDSYFSPYCRDLDSTYRRTPFCGAAAVAERLSALHISNKLILLNDDDIVVEAPSNFADRSHGSVFGNHIFPQRMDTSFQNRDVDSTVAWISSNF